MSRHNNTRAPERAGRRARVLIVIGLLLVLIAANTGIWRNERILAQGEVVLLPLAPVDPRSLMQGDYMQLRFELEEQIESVLRLGAEAARARGLSVPEYAVLAVRLERIGHLVRLQSELAPVQDGELVVRFKANGNNVTIVPGAYFFEEGRGEHFAAARYGELRIAADGSVLLTGLRDEHLEPL